MVTDWPTLTRNLRLVLEQRNRENELLRQDLDALLMENEQLRTQTCPTQTPIAVTSPKPDLSEPLVVSPKVARTMLNCSNTRIYELINAGEVESFLIGRSRKITIESIRQYVAMNLKAPPQKAKVGSHYEKHRK